jgi:hypothetical protein
MYYKERKIKAESSTKEQIGKKIVETAVKQLDAWVYKELEKLKHGKFPVCLYFDDKTLYVGGLFIKSVMQNMYQVYDNEKTIHVFYSKHAAVLYALLIYVKYIKVANDILNSDIQVAKNYDDTQYYKKMLSKLLKDKTSDNYSIIKDKLHESQHRYKFNVEELEKIVTNAKYMKVWEKLK